MTGHQVRLSDPTPKRFVWYSSYSFCSYCTTRTTVGRELCKVPKTSIPRIIEDNDEGNVSREVLFETTMCVIRGEIIRFSCQKKRDREAKLKDLNEQILNLSEREEELACYEKDQLEEFREAMSEIIEVMTEKNIFNVRWDGDSLLKGRPNTFTDK